MSFAETEACYYRAYYSFILQKSGFRNDFEMLVDAYRTDRDSFLRFSKRDLLRIKQLQDAYMSGRSNPFPGEFLPEGGLTVPIIGNSDQKHAELVQNIYRYRQQTLEPFIGTIDDACFEYPVIFGKIDLMVVVSRCAYVIEVKTDTATHSIVGQAMKYYTGLCLKLIQKFWDEVKMVCVCPGYDPASYNGLRSIGARTLLIDSNLMKTSEV